MISARGLTKSYDDVAPSTTDPPPFTADERTLEEQTMKTSTYYLLGVGAAVGTTLFLILAIGALGIIGDGGRDDRMYLAVPTVLVLGTIVARLRAPGMSLALLATAATQVLVTVVALVAGVPKEASILDILGINAMFAALFCLSAWLFRLAADGPVVATESRA